ncbi:FAD-dependent oxidoreductase [Cohnella candidum]|uniref:FAD-binding oxidoreductase n=1 Tax=Cohnella candidum TaxID=2674991 RepID=A0A3G3K1A3_9BACL|nr:FAD-dependent oxidoreductase [Cohnella candidum]AYQ74160.1 FAD-binding oxidoreductase [Cohnella candidum]
MRTSPERYEAVVIGGGFYGCSIAIKLRETFDKVLLVEKEPDLLSRASLVNQARVHNGYHYPRNLVTAIRSYVNFPRFIEEFKPCIVDDFTKLYGIARMGSKVNAYQFHQMFKGIGAPIERARERYRKFFNPELMEELFEVKEFAFDAVVLKNMMRSKMERAGVTYRTNTEVWKVEKGPHGDVRVLLNDGETLNANCVYNCTYSQINKLMGNSELPLLPFKHEITEMALIEMPEELKNIGITVMDGPFFSTMPYPSENLHSLSHVRYTPHLSWSDYEQLIDGHQYLKTLNPESRYLYMIRDVQRYLPAISQAAYKKSIYEVKTVLLQNENDDGRPILYREYPEFQSFVNIMGGKIDNIYDVLESLDERLAIFREVAVSSEFQ